MPNNKSYKLNTTIVRNNKSYKLNTIIMPNNKSYKLNTTIMANKKSYKLNTTIMPTVFSPWAFIYFFWFLGWASIGEGR